jgi:hypothetical protein
MGAPVLQCHDQSRRSKVGKEKAMATAKEAQHDAAESLFGAIIAVLDNHESEHTLTPEILEELARAYAAVAASGVPDHPRLGA